MKHLAVAAALAATLVLPGCVIIDADEDDYSAEFSTSSSRTVHGALVDADKVSIWVRSSGCTSEQDFSFDVDRESDRSYSVEFRRDEPDTCRRAPFSKQLTWTLDELGIPENASVMVDHAVKF
ncbi:MAG: hypothetical protein AAFO57_12175 [Pseudomonadota bacterium]